jgi:hypothetical protein
MFSMVTQGYAVTSGRWERSTPSLSALCGHPRRCNTTRGHCDDIPDAAKAHGDRTSPRPPLCLVRSPVDSTLESVRGRRPGDQPLHCYPRSRSCTSTGLATMPQQERDSSGRSSTPQHCSPYLYT